MNIGPPVFAKSCGCGVTYCHWRKRACMMRSVLLSVWFLYLKVWVVQFLYLLIILHMGVITLIMVVMIDWYVFESVPCVCYTDKFTFCLMFANVWRIHWFLFSFTPSLSRCYFCCCCDKQTNITALHCWKWHGSLIAQRVWFQHATAAEGVMGRRTWPVNSGIGVLWTATTLWGQCSSHLFYCTLLGLRQELHPRLLTHITIRTARKTKHRLNVEVLLMVQVQHMWISVISDVKECFCPCVLGAYGTSSAHVNKCDWLCKRFMIAPHPTHHTDESLPFLLVDRMVYCGFCMWLGG